jgi:hypothetical protein
LRKKTSITESNKGLSERLKVNEAVQVWSQPKRAGPPRWRQLRVPLSHWHWQTC